MNNTNQNHPIKNKRMLGNFLLLLTAMIWGTAFVFQRVGMESIEPVTFTASRMTIAALAVGLVTLFLRFKQRNTPPPTPQTKKYAVIGGILCGTFLASASLLQQIGIVDTAAGKAGFITSLYILLVPVLQLILLRQKSPWPVWLAVLIGLIGMYLLCVKDGFSLTFGDAMLLGCALLFSGHILCCDHFVKQADPLLLSVIQFITAAVISAVAAWILETPTWDKIVSAAVPILYCGIVSGGIGYTLQIIAQKHTDPAIASLLMSLESVFAVLAGALVLGERMSIQEIIGCVLLFSAILIAETLSAKKKT